MAEIKCPKCGEVIKLDKSSYDTLLNEIEKEEIDKRVLSNTKMVEEKLRAQFELEANKNKINKDETILKLQNEIEILKQKVNNNDTNIKLAISETENKFKEELNNKDQQINKLTSEVSTIKKDAQIKEQNLINDYNSQLSIKDVEIEKWKNYRMGDSTKDLGESLEQYCHDAFEEIRAVAYPNAYFEKDNEVIDGGKGDFIFRDYKEDIEVVSIMFDMKNQKDDTEKKHKNEDFFKKLDADRKKKNCEYAVLVSTLEENSALYNRGIVDVSHKYPKMFVVRPQFFLAIIGLIRNMALKSFEYQKAVITYQKENMDITNFEAALKAVSDRILADYDKAEKLYVGVDKMCDDIIKKVNDFREIFRKAQGHIGAAVNQLDNLSVKKLTKNNPTMKAKFEEIK